MSNRITYNTEGLYIGPCPSSGSHFLFYNGQLDVNDGQYIETYYSQTGENSYGRGEWFPDEAYEYYTLPAINGAVYNQRVKDKNLGIASRAGNAITRLERIQNIGYSFVSPYTEVNQIGTKSNVDRVVIESPVINIDFDYLCFGVRNEYNLGLMVNFPMLFYPFSGEPYFSGNNFFLFSGFDSENLVERGPYLRGEGWRPECYILTGASGYTPNAPTYTVLYDPYSGDEWRQHRCITDNDPYYPYNYRDKHNFFVNIVPEGVDEKSGVAYNESISNPLTGSELNYHYMRDNTEVIGFGDCQMVSYSCQGSVGGLPRANASFIGNNIIFYGTGVKSELPSINPKIGESISKSFSIPGSRDSSGPSALMPGDITLDLNFPELGLNLNNAYIQSYNFDISIGRKSEISLGYKYPYNRSINYPIYVNGTFSLIIKDHNQENYINSVNNGEEASFYISLKSPLCDSELEKLEIGAFYDGIPTESRPNVITYEGRGAKIENVNFTSSIGGEKTADVSFSIELNPEDYTKGFFISGQLYKEKIEGLLLDEGSGNAQSDVGLLLMEDGSSIIADMFFV